MDYELIFWISAAVISIVAFAVLNLIAERESKNYVEWVAEGDVL